MTKSIWQHYWRYRKQFIPEERKADEYILNRYYADVVGLFIVRVAYRLGLSPNMLT